MKSVPLWLPNGVAFHRFREKPARVRVDLALYNGGDAALVRPAPVYSRAMTSVTVLPVDDSMATTRRPVAPQRSCADQRVTDSQLRISAIVDADFSVIADGVSV